MMTSCSIRRVGSWRLSCVAGLRLVVTMLSSWHVPLVVLVFALDTLSVYVVTAFQLQALLLCCWSPILYVALYYTIYSGLFVSVYNDM